MGIGKATKDLLGGIAKGAELSVKQLAQAVAHPLKTASALAKEAVHPVDTFEHMKAGVAAEWDHSKAGFIGELIGEVAVSAAMAPALSGVAGAGVGLTKGTAVAGDASAVGEAGLTSRAFS